MSIGHKSFFEFCGSLLVSVEHWYGESPSHTVFESEYVHEYPEVYVVE